MPIGGKLVLKGGASLKGSVKKSKHKKSKASAAAVAAADEDGGQHKQEDAAEQPGMQGVCRRQVYIDAVGM